ncbi:hypothetical protein D3C87_670000 [compost metagenome]
MAQVSGSGTMLPKFKKASGNNFFTYGFISNKFVSKNNKDDLFLQNAKFQHPLVSNLKFFNIVIHLS